VKTTGRRNPEITERTKVDSADAEKLHVSLGFLLLASRHE
jgi:hypothetical protein